MNARTLLSVLSLTCFLGGSGVAASLGYGTTYQGRLMDGANVANGSFDVRFAIYHQAVGGTYDVMTTNANVSVVNGLFTTLANFGAGPTSFNESWMELAVRPAGSAVAFAVLSPRQLLTATPYAFYATNAAVAAQVTGPVPDGLLSGNIPRLNGSPTFSGTASFAPAAGPPFTVGSATLVPSLNADFLDGFHANSFVLRSGDTLSGNLTLAPPATLNFGSSVRQMINLWSTSYGIGVQADATYFRSFNDFAWYRQGVHSNDHFNAGGGQTLMSLTTNGLNVSGTVTAQGAFVASGDPGVNTVFAINTGAGGTGVYSSTDFFGPGGDADSVGVLGRSTRGTGLLGISTDIDGVVGLKGASAKSYTMEGGVYGEATTASGRGVVGVATNGAAAMALYGYAPQGYAAYLNGRARVSANSWIDTPTLQLYETETSDFARLELKAGANHPWHLAAGGGQNDLNFWNGTAYADVMTLKTNGTLYVNVLTIRGGADVAEPFEMSNKEVPKGAVVIIDEEHPGQLKLSERAYDTRVAGVVSGANGIRPGLTLQQEGTLAGGQNVALTGRVYVQADATSGAIKPGDLLTTSDTAGHAMKVGNHASAQGAILGKAMTGLKEGRGLVLVLVTLQ